MCLEEGLHECMSVRHIILSTSAQLGVVHSHRKRNEGGTGVAISVTVNFEHTKPNFKGSSTVDKTLSNGITLYGGILQERTPTSMWQTAVILCYKFAIDS